MVARVPRQARERLEDPQRRADVPSTVQARASLVELLPTRPDVGLQSDVERQRNPIERAGGVGGGARGSERG